MVDPREIKKLIDLAKTNELTELEVQEGDKKIRIALPNQRYFVQQEVPQPLKKDSSKSKQPETLTETEEELKGHIVKSPMVGTIYLSPTPGSKPFVEIGQQVKTGDTLCLIEAMKTFNKIESDAHGVLSACLVENSQPTEFDQPLFIIEKKENVQ